MTMRPHFVMIGLLVSLMLMGCRAEQVTDEFGQTRPLSIREHVAGSEPNLEMGWWVVNSAEELQALGSEELADLRVNFDRHSLLVIAWGERPAGSQVRIRGVQQEGQTLFVQAEFSRPEHQTGEVAHPFAAAVIERTSPQLVIVEPRDGTLHVDRALDDAPAE